MVYAFNFIVGYSLSDYIRKRKLSLAFHRNEESGCGWDKVLEIAFQRQYLSSPAQYLKGERKVSLVEPLIIESVNCNFIEAENKGQYNKKQDEGGFKMIFDVDNADDLNRLNRYLDMQMLYDLTIGQIMIAESMCNDMSVSMYTACAMLEKEYKELDVEAFNDFYKDCFYLSIKHRFSKEISEKIVSEIKRNSILDIRQLDSNYIGAINFAVDTAVFNGFTRKFSYELYCKIREAIKPEVRDPNFCGLCYDLICGYSVEEINLILDNFDEKEFEKDIWYVMYQINMKRENAEHMIRTIQQTSDFKIQDMDIEYLWFLESLEGDNRTQLAKKAPYCKYVDLKKKIKENHLYNDSTVNDVIQCIVDDGWDFDKAIEFGKWLDIPFAIRMRRENFVKHLYSEYYTDEELMNMLDKYYPEKVPSVYSSDLENAEDIWDLLSHNSDRWEMMEEVEELEFLIATSTGISIEESQLIVTERLKTDNVDRFLIDYKYTVLHYHYFGSDLFDDEHKWNGELIPYEMCEQIYEYALANSKSEDRLWHTILARIAHALIYRECKTIEEAFEKFPNFNLDNMETD